LLSARPRLAFFLAEALAHLGEIERALTLGLAAEGEFRTRHDRVNLLEALNLVGALQFELGDLTGAEERFSTLLELAGESGDDEMSGRATNNLGAIATLRSEYERALSLYRLSVPAYQKAGHLMGLAQTDHNLAIVHRDLGHWAEADRHYRRAVARAKQVGDPRLEAMASVGRAEISHRQGDDVYAEAEATRAMEAFEEIGDELGRADALRLLGAVAGDRGDEETAMSRFDRALDLARAHSNPLLEAEILEERGELHLRAGRTVRARADFTLAAARYRSMGALERCRQAEARGEDR
jgi:tetratricopeptide (TPR) repeat protein